MFDLEVYGVALLPIIVGLVAIIKTFKIPARFLPLASIAIGVLLGIFYVAPDDPRKAVLVGINLGLAAVGLHSGYKHSFNKGKKTLVERELKEIKEKFETNNKDNTPS